MQTQAPDLAWGQRHRGTGREERGTQSGDSPGTLVYHRLSFIPAHPFKEAGVTITVGLLGPQDVSGFEGLAVLLLGSLYVVLWRTEEAAVSKQGSQVWEDVSKRKGKPQGPGKATEPITWPPPAALLRRKRWHEQKQNPNLVSCGHLLCRWQKGHRGQSREDHLTLMVHAFNPRGGQTALCKFKDSLVYIDSSKPARVA